MTLNDELWAQLNAGRVEQGFVRIRIDRSLRIYAARNAASGLEALLIEVATSAVPSGELPRSRGFELRAIPTRLGRDGTTLFILECGAKEFSTVFRALADDIHRALQMVKSEEKALQALIERLYKWQTFLRDYRAGGLTPQQQLGLYGELFFLKNHLLTRLPGKIAVQGWDGPAARNHDFNFARLSIEVKTTCAKPAVEFRVSNVEQLSSDSVESLAVYLIALEISEVMGQSLPGIVEDIRGDLSQHEREKFNEKLVFAGYLDAEARLYENANYRGAEERLFEVRPGFPRLVQEQVPEGVIRVKYSCVIGACRPFEVDLSNFLDDRIN